MARKKVITASKIKQLKKQGRGQGKGYQYKPWLTIRDVPSTGFCHRILGWKTGRTHHLLSNLELSFFYQLEWSPFVADIREKFPLLEIEQTLDIASKLGISHPRAGKKREAIVLTTDFLVNFESKDNSKVVAYSVMPSTKLDSRKTLERTLIEKMYWKHRGVKFIVVTEMDINKTLSDNVGWIHSAKELTFSPGVSFSMISEIEPILAEHLSSSRKPFSKLCTDIDKKFGLVPGACLWIVQYLIANRYWLVDMNSVINSSKKLNFTRNIAWVSRKNEVVV
jgi:hypothetical protein